MHKLQIPSDFFFHNESIYVLALKRGPQLHCFHRGRVRSFPQDVCFPSQPLLFTERTWALVTFTLSPRASLSLLICPWCPRRFSARSKSPWTRQALTVSLQYPGSWHSANFPEHHIRVADECFHSLQMGISNIYQLSFTLLVEVWLRFSWLRCLPKWSLFHPLLFPGHHIHSVIALLQAEKEPSFLLPKVTMLFISFLLISFFFLDGTKLANLLSQLLFLSWLQCISDLPSSRTYMR